MNLYTGSLFIYLVHCR